MKPIAGLLLLVAVILLSIAAVVTRTQAYQDKISAPYPDREYKMPDHMALITLIGTACLILAVVMFVIAP